MRDPEIKSWAEIKTWMLNQWSHPGALIRVLLNQKKHKRFCTGKINVPGILTYSCGIKSRALRLIFSSEWSTALFSIAFPQEHCSCWACGGCLLAAPHPWASWRGAPNAPGLVLTVWTWASSHRPPICPCGPSWSFGAAATIVTREARNVLFLTGEADPVS